MKKSLIAAIVLASASFGSAPVLAQVIGNSPQALDLVDMSAYFGDSFEEGNSGSTFADRFTFTVDGTVGMNLDAIVASVSRSADVGLDITGLWLYDGNDTLISQGTSMSTGATDVWTVAGGNLAAGDYTIRVNGNMVSDDGASFGGAMMLAPVPEPEAYGMMLGGLGVLGLLARRRKARRG
ncbi:PEP-CTERM sorting domain-containing protein [Massilia sp. Dwa41.01b]|uniref:FxDxF family PEP-CTERM protein n=1 Tax=unclassified Massilia TaxID=2609279 RepID=UPI0016008AAA|nr:MULTISPECIES: FxDxF family PEP-CTERM protein [unclassified Massilia]QNA88804.1 PEP-CTERM sorting domain-containing protein [Massilia sp. Dwa41.01b]QNA99701.1 PEP-CTERM sorting domain-containing protein [Massilia sp. Se16.2.3]